MGEPWVYGSPEEPWPRAWSWTSDGTAARGQGKVSARGPQSQGGEPEGWAASRRQPHVPRWALVALSSPPWVLISWSRVFSPGHPS